MEEDIKITFAAQDKIDKYTKGVYELLDLIGQPEALVTDESTLGDFYSGAIDPDIMTVLIDALHFTPVYSDRIWFLGNCLEVPIY